MKHYYFLTSCRKTHFNIWHRSLISNVWNWISKMWICSLPGKSHGQRGLEGCNPWGRWGSDTTERLHFHFSLSHIGEGNGNPLQCSCLENSRVGEAWWAAIYGVAQSQTRLKQLSSSSSSRAKIYKLELNRQSVSNLSHSLLLYWLVSGTWGRKKSW